MCKFKENNQNEQFKDLIERFPKCELSYGQLDHTKVQYDLYAIPAGKKMMVWFFIISLNVGVF